MFGFVSTKDVDRIQSMIIFDICDMRGSPIERETVRNTFSSLTVSLIESMHLSDVSKNLTEFAI